MFIAKPVAAAAVATAAVVVAACGSSSESDSTTGAASSKGGVKSIFFANPLPAYPDWATADRCFKAETKKLGIKGVTQGPTGLQVNDQFVLDRISQAIAQKYDAVMAVPITPTAYEPLFQRAQKDGMKIATLNTGDSTKTQDFTVGTDYAVQGAQVAANIGKRPGQQNVGIITNQAGGVGATIIDAFKQHLPANVKVVATAFDGADPSR